MKLFLDTANIDEIRHGIEMGVVAGVTTNPSLAASEGVRDLLAYGEAVKQITSIVSGPVSAEVFCNDALSMVEQGRTINAWAENVVVKLPSTSEGFSAMNILSGEGVSINQTLCFSVNQALLGVQAGASYVSPFVGRIDDTGGDGILLVRDIVEIFDKHSIQVKVLAASLRNPLHVVQAAKAGAHYATLPYKVLMQMIKHPLTDAGVIKFEQDLVAVASNSQ